MSEFIKKYGFQKDYSKLKLVLKKNVNYKKIDIKNKDKNSGQYNKRRFFFIAGPCSIENEKQAFTIAEKLVSIGIDVFRGGIFKPRTSPYDFQGLEMKGLEILVKIKEKFNIPVITEAITIEHLHLLKNKADIVQIGARNMFNYPLLKEAGKIKTPILLKRAMSATYYEFLSSAEYILQNGNKNVILCERGIRTFESSTRNTPDIAAIPFLKKITDLPVFFDPSHSIGISEIIKPISLAAVAAGADGIVIEVHNKPEKALSDAKQQITPEEYSEIYSKILKILEII